MYSLDINPPPKNRNRFLFLTQLVAVAGGVLIFGGGGRFLLRLTSVGVLVTRIVAKAHSLTISAGNAKRHEVFKKMGYLPADPSDIKLRVLPSYTFVPMSEVEQDVQQMVAARAQAVPEPDPIYNLPAAKRQATITSYFRK